MSEKSQSTNWLKQHREQYDLCRKRGRYGLWCVAVGFVIAAVGLFALMPTLLHTGLVVTLVGVTVAIWLFERADEHARRYEKLRVALEEFKDSACFIGVWS